MPAEQELYDFGVSLRALLSGLLGTGTDVAGTRAAAAAAPSPAAFPGAGIDAFTSHFVFSLTFAQGAAANKVINVTLPTSIQTVSRSDPFIYRGPGKPEQVTVPLPAGCTLSDTITESDFPEHPDDFFIPGRQTVWMQILNLDARGETPFGPARIILGETLKREYPDLFQPSLGVAQSAAGKGFPATLFFDPTAVMETPVGNYVAVHGVLAYARVFEFPPIGSPVTIRKVIPLHSVDDLRSKKNVAELQPQAQILALSHNIDSPVQLPADEAFNLVEANTGGAG